MLENEAAKQIFPSDVLERAKLYLDNIGSTGAYSESRGAAICREQIAEVCATFRRQADLQNYRTLLDLQYACRHHCNKHSGSACTRAALPCQPYSMDDFRVGQIRKSLLSMQGIERRDGYPANPDNIFICDGASAGVHLMMRSLLRDDSDAILTPIPQYPLYSAAIALYGGHLLPYYLDETHEWGMNVAAMEEQVKQVLAAPAYASLNMVTCPLCSIRVHCKLAALPCLHCSLVLYVKEIPGVCCQELTHFTCNSSSSLLSWLGRASLLKLKRLCRPRVRARPCVGWLSSTLATHVDRQAPLLCYLAWECWNHMGLNVD